MKIYVKNVPELELESPCTDKELIVHLQAQDRGITTGTKVLVNYDGGRRFLDIEAIDRKRTLPNVAFAGYSVPPPASSQVQDRSLAGLYLPSLTRVSAFAKRIRWWACPLMETIECA